MGSDVPVSAMNHNAKKPQRAQTNGGTSKIEDEQGQSAPADDHQEDGKKKDIVETKAQCPSSELYSVEITMKTQEKLRWHFLNY